MTWLRTSANTCSPSPACSPARCARSSSAGYAALADLAMIQLLGVVLVAARFSVRVSMLACVAGILAFDFLLVPPQFAFAWTDTESSLTFIAMLVVAF